MFGFRNNFTNQYFALFTKINHSTAEGMDLDTFSLPSLDVSFYDALAFINSNDFRMQFLITCMSKNVFVQSIVCQPEGRFSRNFARKQRFIKGHSLGGKYLKK